MPACLRVRSAAVSESNIKSVTCARITAPAKRTTNPRKSSLMNWTGSIAIAPEVNAARAMARNTNNEGVAPRPRHSSTPLNGRFEPLSEIGERLLPKLPAAATGRYPTLCHSETETLLCG